MNKAKLFIRQLADRWLGRAYEGPDPPRRIVDEVKMFQVCYPNATAEQWQRFAVRFGENLFRDGFTRGYQFRTLEGEPGVVLEDLNAPHDWAPSDDPLMAEVIEELSGPNDPLRGVSPEERAKFLDFLRQMHEKGIPVYLDEG